MKKHLLFYTVLLLSFYGPLQAQSGINIDEFSTAVLPTGWTSQNLTFFDATNSCELVSINANASNQEGFLISPNYQGVSNGRDVYISLVSRSIENINNNVEFDIQYSTDNGSTWKDHPDWDVTYLFCFQGSTIIPGDAIVAGSDFKFRIRTHFIEIDNSIFSFRDLVIKQDTELPNCDATITAYPSRINSSGLVNGALRWSKPTGGTIRRYTLSIGTTSGGTNVLPLTELGDVTNYFLNNLNPLTTYYVSLVPINGLGSATGCQTQSFTLPANPVNTSCEFAESLIVNTDGSCAAVKSGTIAQTQNGVWYSFTATQSSHLVSLKNVQASSAELTSSTPALEMSVHDSSRSSRYNCYEPYSVEIAPNYGNLENSRLLKNLKIGTLYYVHVRRQSSSNIYADFDICVGSEATASCGDTLSDSGGTDGAYAPSESSTTVITPSNPSQFVTLTFNNFDIHSSDSFVVYNGPDSSGEVMFSTPIAEGSIPGPITSSHSTGALTVKFDTFIDADADADVAEGYDILVSCSTLSCSPPYDLTTTTTTDTSAELSWTVGAFKETVWNIQYGKSGFTLGEGTEVQASTNPFTINGLEDGVLYDYYVQADCGNGDTSTWSDSFEFVTQFTNISCTTPTVITKLPFQSLDKNLSFGQNISDPVNAVTVSITSCDFDSEVAVLWYHFFVETSGTVDISCIVPAGYWGYSLRLFSGMDCMNNSCAGFSPGGSPTAAGESPANTLSDIPVTAGTRYWLAIQFANSAIEGFGSYILANDGSLDVSITSNDVTLYESENARKSTDDFVMTFQTTTANEIITIPTAPGETYNYEVDWEGEGTFEDAPYTTNASHPYTEAGDHSVRIRGTFPRIYFNDGPEKDKIQSIDQWGTNEWTSMENAFFGCSNLQINATDAPNLSNATNLSRMFSDASSMNAPLNNWDVSTIINMTGMFSGANAFNQPLNDWEVSEVTDMTGLFSGASAFNQPLNTWDISNVTAMDEMLDNTALTLENYEVILETWSQLEGLQSGVILGAAGLRYSDCVQPERDILISAPNNWTITDGGLVAGCPTDDFVMTWRTTSPNETITIPTDSDSTYNYEVDWDGDGVFENMIFDGNASHTYPEPGIHTVRIKGMFPRIYFHFDLEVSGQKDKILSVEQWGINEWASMNDAFWGCSNLEIVATDAPNLSNATNLSGMFANANKVNSPLSHWDVSTIENMRSMFSYAIAFNQSLASWNVSNVDDMTAMLDSSNLSVENYSATLEAWSQLEGLQSGVTLGAFRLRYSNCVQPERDILTAAPNYWKITDGDSVENCPTDDFVMTWRTTSPNETITIPTAPGETYNYEVDWEGNGIYEETLYTTNASHPYAEVGNQTVRIKGTFPRIYFNNAGDKDKIQSVVQWGTNEWTSMEKAFSGCSNLQITATAAPNLSNVTDLSEMFKGATSMNVASLKDWDVSNVTDMTGLFSGASAFNQSLASWDVSNVTDMTGLFSGASAFNQSLASWNVSNVTVMDEMLDNTALSTGHYSAILEAWSQLEGLQPGVILGAVGLRYSDCVQPQKDILTSAPNNWTITDGGLVAGCLTDDFVTTWETTSPNETITIPTDSDSTYNYEVDWDGDGVFENMIFDGNASHTYPEPGIHTVRIKGMFPRIYFHNDLEVFGQKDKILSVEQWGTNEWTSMNDAFWGCSNLEIVATDAPNLSSVTDLSGMFAEAYKVNSPLSHWDVSTITNMKSMFEKAITFNQSLASWNVSNVDNMRAMLDYSNLSVENYSATLEAWSQLEGLQSGVTLNAVGLRYSNCVQPERDILTAAPNNWKITDGDSVENCPTDDFVMTWRTTSPNETITIPTAPGETYNYEVDWEGNGIYEETLYTTNASHPYAEVGNQTVRIKGTFPRIYFNNAGDKDKIQSVVQWGTNEWTSMEKAFSGCSNLQITATAAPNLSNVTDLSEMFKGATSMNAASLKDWDVSNVTDMTGLFSGASAFNQSLASWNVSNVTDMTGLFSGASAFNQPLNTWNVSNVTDMTGLFSGASAFNQSLASWNVSNVTDMTGLFSGASAFNQPLNTWDISNVTDMTGLFSGASAFNQPLNTWNVSNVTAMDEMLDNTALTLENYEVILETWSQLEGLQSGVILGAAGLRYSDCVQPQKDILTSAPNNWTITDGDSVENCPTGDFVMTWRTTSPNETITIPTLPDGIYNYEVDWDGDSVFENMIFDGNASHTYPEPGIHTVRIKGMFPRIYFHNDLEVSDQKDKILSVEQWGTNEWASMNDAFWGCSNLEINATDAPNLSNATDLSGMFAEAYKVNSPLSHWDVSTIENMRSMFFNAFTFNQSLASWNVSNVNDMTGMLFFLSVENYSKTLVAWSQLEGLQSDVTLNAGGLRYSNCVQPERDILTAAPNRWTISDSGPRIICSESDFVMTWRTTTPNETITIPTHPDETYNYEVDWEGLGVFEEPTTTGTHTYSEPGDHTIRIRGTFPRIYFNDGPEKDKIQSIDQWGTNEWPSMEKAFSGCSNLQITATAAPNLSNVTDLSEMFKGATSMNAASLKDWDVSNVTNMSYMFSGATAFNQPLASWDVLNVTDMTGLFSGASAFNQPLNTWDISNVTVMDEMLDNTALSTGHYSAILKAWSQLEGLQPGVILGAVGLRYSDCVQPQKDILTAAPNNWKITDGDSVENCPTDDFVMTWRTTSPNETITIPTAPGETYNYEVDWDGDSVFENMIFDGNASHTYPEPGIHTVRIKGMFPRIYFHNDLEVSDQKDKILSVEQWGTNEWTSMNDAFWGCSNLEINATDAPNLSNATDLSAMFAEANKVNSPLNHWDVSTIENMRSMFFNAFAFNQSLASWNVSNVNDMTAMVFSLSVENYSKTLVAWSQLEGLQSDVTFNAYYSIYSNCVQPERDILTAAPNRWTISDNGSRIICLESDFVMTWRTTTPNETITIPTHPDETYNYEVDWEGLGVFEEPTTTGTHTYSEPGDHTIRIRGTFPRIYFNDGPEKDKIQSIDQWGTKEWTSMENAFFGCSNLQITATDAPNLSNVTDLSEMFKGATSMNAASLMDWDVSNVTDMTGLFSGATAFNQPLNTWDISNVTDMANMLDNSGLSTDRYSDTLEGWSQLESLNAEVSLGALGLTYFECIQPAVNILLNRPNLWTITDDGVVDRCVLPFITTWVTTTANEAITIPTAPGETYNYDIDWNNDGVWDVIGATGNESHTYDEEGDHTIRIKGVFPRIYFHNDIEVPGQKDKIQSVDQWGDIQWNSMDSAFSGCSILRIYATDAPDLSNITSMLHMFSRTSSMNAASLNDWDVSNVTNMSYMFLNATAFNQPLSNWEVSEVTNMSYMFSEAETFNQSLASWDISNVTNMTNMLDNSGLSTDHYSAILEAWSQLEGLPSGVIFDANGLMYSNCVQPQKDILTAAPNNWNITDAGFVDECSSTPTSYLQIGVDSRTISTILGIESTKHGVLLPRLTEVEMQAITTPAEGLMVYCLDCTTKGLYIYDGADFITLRTGN